MMISYGPTEPIACVRFHFTDAALRDEVRAQILGPGAKIPNINFSIGDEPWLDVWAQSSVLEDLKRQIVLWKPTARGVTGHTT